DILIGLASADDAVVRPDRCAGIGGFDPLPLLDDIRVCLLHELAHSAQGLPAPVSELGDSLRDELRGRPVLARLRLLHVRHPRRSRCGGRVRQSAQNDNERRLAAIIQGRHLEAPMASTRTALLLALIGCAQTMPSGESQSGGSGGGMAGGTGAGGAAGMSGPDAGAPAEADRPGLVPFARLTSIEYRNTLRDLVGLTQPEPGLLAPGFDNWQGPFASGAGRGPNDVDTITRIAFLAAEAAAKNLAALLPCPPLPAGATEEEACAQKFIAQFGLRAYRRPLDDPEQAALLALYRALRGPQGQADFTTAIRLLIEAM